MPLISGLPDPPEFGVNIPEMIRDDGISRFQGYGLLQIKDSLIISAKFV